MQWRKKGASNLWFHRNQWKRKMTRKIMLVAFSHHAKQHRFCSKDYPTFVVATATLSRHPTCEYRTFFPLFCYTDRSVFLLVFHKTIVHDIAIIIVGRFPNSDVDSEYKSQVSFFLVHRSSRVPFCMQKQLNYSAKVPSIIGNRKGIGDHNQCSRRHL
jgi:hypothetical protein